jgi:isoaspartyl peptidase/L-asparaginase-like protein (Ntn-hydrolase superfamily)
VHAGAGRAPERDPAAEAEARGALAAALRAGFAALSARGSALDAVERAVRILEDCPLFNAGRGAALTSAGDVELDAAVMDGAGRRLGAVAAVRGVPNPVSLARLVLERTPHVLLVGPGAEAFAAAQGVPRVEPASLATDARRAELARARAGARPPGAAGTVGAVARDAAAHLAAATSTGGVTAQLPGRVGDSPLAGAGTWADDASCAVSGTGQGEGFVRAAFAHEVDARVRLLGEPLERACAEALARVRELGFAGGCIAVDRGGRLALPCTTPAFARGWIGADGVPRVALRAGEPETPAA